MHIATTASIFVLSISTATIATTTPPDHGLNFVTIGDPGNRDSTLKETMRNPQCPNCPGAIIGGVEYEFRMMVTEVTVGQYFEFVVAYLPIYERNTGNAFGSTAFRGRAIRTANSKAMIRIDHSENEATTLGWEYAARFVNWLHNDKINEEWAFETGVYDTSTFTQNPDGSWNHQLAHNPGARYWIPTYDEWTKAAYWDPNKDDGQGGYWQFQNTSDIEPLPGLPEDGGERNAGDSDIFPLDVGSYPTVQSPWGLLDMAGGAHEYTETIPSADEQESRIMMGSRFIQDDYGDIFSLDRLASGLLTSATFGGRAGLRLASAVRHPGDLNKDWSVDYFDISYFLRRFIAGDIEVDLDNNGILDIEDVYLFVDLF